MTLLALDQIEGLGVELVLQLREDGGVNQLLDLVVVQRLLASSAWTE